MSSYNLKQYIDQFSAIIDNTESETSDIPHDKNKNVDKGKQNHDLSNDAIGESDVPINKEFNTLGKNANDDLANDVEDESDIPVNGKFNVNKGSNNPDLANPIDKGSSAPFNVNKNKNLANKPMYENQMVPSEVKLYEQPKTSSRRYKFSPQMGIEDIYTKLHMESVANDSPVFSLDLSSVVMDKINCKFVIKRNFIDLVVELMYPNANGRLSIRLEGSGLGHVSEITLDSDEYRSLGQYIKKMADELLEKAQAISPYRDEFSEMEQHIGTGYNDREMANVGANPGNEHVVGNIFNSFKGTRLDSINIKGFSALMEAEEDEEADAPEDDIGAGDVNSTSETEIDVTDLGGDGEDAGNDTELGGGAFDDLFGGSGSLDGFGGGSADIDVNVGDGESSTGTAVDSESPTSLFREKEDGFDNSALIGMEKLLAKEYSNASKRGSGVELTPYESYAGTRGIKGKYTNRELIDKFLKVYPELDEIDIPNDILNDIEDKLSEQDSESFDAYIKTVLSEINGDAVDVNINALNNDMFEEFEPMGGEVSPEENFGDDIIEEEPTGDNDLFNMDLDMFNDIEPEPEPEEEQ